jgi:anti-sigma factor ChrR (cupin superfamily)
MRINADFSSRVLLHADEIDWIPSPMPGVDRRPLDRIGGEVARATSIVRYAPGSSFSEHVHDGGEEFLVLEGVFQDQYGDFPAGTYVRNPPTTRHAPASEPGCTILVKLWQFDPEDRRQMRADMTAEGAPDPRRPGVSVLPLHEDDRERVRVETLAPGVATRIPAEGGGELFVLDGSATESGDSLRKHSWVRIPVGAAFEIAAGPEGARLWIKTGHLRHVAAPDAA